MAASSLDMLHRPWALSWWARVPGVPHTVRPHGVLGFTRNLISVPSCMMTCVAQSVCTMPLLAVRHRQASQPGCVAQAGAHSNLEAVCPGLVAGRLRLHSQPAVGQGWGAHAAFAGLITA